MLQTALLNRGKGRRSLLSKEREMLPKTLIEDITLEENNVVTVSIPLNEYALESGIDIILYSFECLVCAGYKIISNYFHKALLSSSI